MISFLAKFDRCAKRHQTRRTFTQCASRLLENPMKILVVDDYPTMRRILRNLLGQIGMTDVEEAGSGGEAFSKLQAAQFDLVISDWNMEPVTGLELLKKVRANAPTSKLPFIMVTAESKTENVIEAKKAGVNNYIVKPFTADILKSKIAAVMG
jgi:two-component system chemotaxis response regulator CheY